MRLDAFLVQEGYFETRSRAQAAILAGDVRVDGRLAQKAGESVSAPVRVDIRKAPPFVSRGGLKLQKALEAFEVSAQGLVCLDSGASTGGFTDCLLQHGARRVYAVDVGYGQLALRLREDERVVVHERTNLRTMAPPPEAIDLVTLDLSFISLRLVLGNVVRFMQPGGDVLALVKPQFEAGRDRVGKKGVVRDAAVHEQVLRDVIDAAESIGLGALALTHSPVRGPEGNIEFWLRLRKEGSRAEIDVPAGVRAAWQELT